jgi:hypothetical protein
MLISTTDEQFTKEQRIDFFLRGTDAFDPETGAELEKSGGRRKGGRGARYICRVPSGETLAGGDPLKRRAFTVTAHSEQEAIERANKALARFVGKGPRWDDERYEWVFAQPTQENQT